MRAFTLSLLALFCLGLAPAAAAEIMMPQQTIQKSIGHLVAAEGQVSAGRTGKPLAVDDPVFLDDIILTGANARAVILFLDDTQITLGENAQLSVDSYVFDADAETSDQGHFSILKGSFLLASGLINKSAQPDMQVNTAYGSIGLRGTIIWGGMTAGQYGVYVQEGNAVVENKSGAAFLSKGEASYIQGAGATPVRVGHWSARRLSDALETVRLRNPAALQAAMAKRQSWNNGIRAQMRESLFRQRQRLERAQEQEKPVLQPAPKAGPERAHTGLAPIMKREREIAPRGAAQERTQNMATPRYNRPDFMKNLRIRPNMNNRAGPND